jgi:hypothetical protein
MIVDASSMLSIAQAAMILMPGGSGPVAAALKTAPSDLTTIAKRHNGKFDVTHVKMNISGETDVTAHGTKDMPVWGAYFRSQRGQSVSSLNVYALAKYLEDVQVR